MKIVNLKTKEVIEPTSRKRLDAVKQIKNALREISKGAFSF